MKSSPASRALCLHSGVLRRLDYARPGDYSQPPVAERHVPDSERFYLQLFTHTFSNFRAEKAVRSLKWVL
jgi:hypothetical protein